MKVLVSKIKHLFPNQSSEYYDEVISSGILSEDKRFLTLTDEQCYILKSKSQLEQIKNTSENPTTVQMIGSLSTSLSGWVSSGLPLSDKKMVEFRLEICKSCDLWDQSGFLNTGRCKKCGCSTQAKLRMATEKCPIGKW